MQIDLTCEQKAALETQHKTERDGRIRDRIKAVLLYDKGWSCSQIAKALLLSDDASADAKPQLEIDNDDVQCSHGAAMGQLDEDSLFYLCSRGISRANAEKMLAEGFVEKLLDSVADESLHVFLSGQLKEKLAQLF